MVERYVRDVEAASSNLVTSTIKAKERFVLSFVFIIEAYRFELLKRLRLIALRSIVCEP